MSGPRAHRIPAAVLDRWYVCGRKRALPSEVIATLYAETTRVKTRAYPCPHGAHWHIGRPQDGRAPMGMNHSRRQNAARLYAEYQSRGATWSLAAASEGIA